MPNWCCQNVVIKGDRNELQSFADVINSLSSREEVTKTGFGKMWLGNLVDALGGNWKAVPCRGTIDASGDCWACLSGPDATDEKAAVGEDGFLRVSITTAWCPEGGLLAFIHSKYPSFEFGYSATDEFGNFHTRWEPDPAMGVPKYVFDGEYYAPNEKAGLIAAMREVTGAVIGDNATDDELQNAFSEWKDALDDTRDWTEFLIYDDEEIFVA